MTLKIKKTQNPELLLLGVPNVHSSYWEMNIAQRPQGPKVEALRSFPKFIRNKVNSIFEDIFNPKKKAPYLGLHLIEQNLRDYLDITLINYPKNDRQITNYVRNNKNLSIIGISIGCENRVYHAKELSRKIRKIRPGIKIIFGNYGAVAGKNLGKLTETDGTVLWDSEEEREIKKSNNLDFYSGEGVHDMKIWLRKHGIEAGDPNAPLISESIPDPDLFPKKKIVKWIAEKIGFIAMPSDMNKIGVSIGCTNNCSFCNTRFKFNRSKSFLYRTADELFKSMEKVIYINEARDAYPPEAAFFLMDENFMKDEKVNTGKGKINFLEVAEELCDLISNSGKNIRWGTFSDIKSLLSYKKKHGNFIDLVRGGMQSIWIGIESREDVFGKRGGASIKEVEKMLKELQSVGIAIIGSFIPGLNIHTEGKNKMKYDSLRLFCQHLESDNREALTHWFEESKDKLLHIMEQVLSDGNKDKIINLVNYSANGNKNKILRFIDRFNQNESMPRHILDENRDELIKAFSDITKNGKTKLLDIFKPMLIKDKYELLNIWEDIDWWIKQNTGARQVMMYSITGVVGKHEHMINLSDYDFGHKNIPGHNQSPIQGKRLEEIDRKAREMFYEKNGPVAITSVLTFWDGFMNLKDSAHPADIRCATYYYWIIKRNLQTISLATFLFNDKIFTKCSDKFLSRLAKMFKEIEKYTPPNSKLHDRFQEVFEIYEHKVWYLSKLIGNKMRERFIEKHLQEAIA